MILLLFCIALVNASSIIGQEAILRVPFIGMRHGQTDWNIRAMVAGQRDIPLNDEGVQEVRNTLPKLRECGITHIYHSPLARARETVLIVAQGLNVPHTEIKDLQECHLGCDEGRYHRDIVVSFSAWQRGATAEGGESYTTLCQRLIPALNQVLEESSNSAGLPLIVFHSRVYRVVTHLLGFTQAMRARNAEALYHTPVPTYGWQINRTDGKLVAIHN